jgi:probable rRNA maturation factor
MRRGNELRALPSHEPAEAAIDLAVLSPVWDRVVRDAAEVISTAARRALTSGLAEGGSVPQGRLELCIVLADDAEQRRLNRDWRGIDRSTNVLSFASWDPAIELPADAPLLLGDVILAYETVAREAEEQGKAIIDHLCHLIIHGVLHLLGYDHATEREAVTMEKLETSILASLGMADPYRFTI